MKDGYGCWSEFNVTPAEVGVWSTSALDFGPPGGRTGRPPGFVEDGFRRNDGFHGRHGFPCRAKPLATDDRSIGDARRSRTHALRGDAAAEAARTAASAAVA